MKDSHRKKLEALQAQTLDIYDAEVQKRPVAKTLLQLVPAFPLFENILTRMMERRAEIFFGELEKGNIAFDEPTARQEELAHRLYIALKAAANTRAEEKVRMFARLFGNASAGALVTADDAYEEYVQLLDSLSFRELLVLEKLHALEQETRYEVLQDGRRNDLSTFEAYAPELYAYMESLLISPEQQDGMLMRLERTGCYQTFRGNYFSPAGGKGRTTANYAAFRAAIQELAS